MIENWTELVIGIIMIVSPWVFGFSDISLAKWCNVLLGLVLVVAGTWSMFGNSPALPVSSVEEPQKRKQRTKNNTEQK